MILTIAGLVILLLGGGAALFFFMQGDIKLTAEQAYAEFAKDTAAANKKYNGKFVRIHGKLTTVTTDKKVEKLVFEGAGDGNWHIVVVPTAADAKAMTAGQEVTIRGRFTQRKAPDGDLQLANCSLVK